MWSRGYPLYGRQAWVDRPQGLLLAYRLVAATGWDPMARVLAVVAGAVATVAVGATAWALAGRRAAVIGAVLFALVSPAPHLEGFTANGELLATAFTSVAVALAAWWWARGRTDRWLLVAAGVVAAVGPLVKQSAFDGLVAVGVLVVASAFTPPHRRGSALARDFTAFLGGALVPFVLAIADGTAIGFGDWWFAMIGHRAQTDSLINGPFAYRVQLFRASLGPFWRDLGVLLPLAAVGVVVAHRARRLTLPLGWLLAAAIGFVIGGLYHPHYWIQLAAPLTLLAALGLEGIAEKSPRVAALVGAGAIAIPLAFALPVYVASTDARVSELTTKDARIVSAKAVGRVRRLHQPAPR